MAFAVDANVLVTCQILKKGESGPETINLVNAPGVVKKASVFPDAPAKNMYHVQTSHGTHFVSESKLAAAPPAEP